MRCKVGYIAIAMGGCNGSCPAEVTSLVDPSWWSEVDVDQDPFADRPETVDCPRAAWIVETDPQPSLEVDTGLCTYLLVDQPSLERVCAGQDIEVEFAHGALVADEPAMAHIAVLVGDLTVVDEEVAIPADARRMTVDHAIQQGVPITVHLHNHGDNSWNITDITSVGGAL